jgi:hypothetical protein
MDVQKSEGKPSAVSEAIEIVSLVIILILFIYLFAPFVWWLLCTPSRSEVRADHSIPIFALLTGEDQIDIYSDQVYSVFRGSFSHREERTEQRKSGRVDADIWEAVNWFINAAEDEALEKIEVPASDDPSYDQTGYYINLPTVRASLHIPREPNEDHIRNYIHRITSLFSS